MSTKKDARTLGIRLDESEAVVLAEIEAATKFAPVAIARAAITAVIRRWKTTQELAIPFFLVTSAELAKMNASTVTPEAIRPPVKNIVVLPPQYTTSSDPDIALANEAAAATTAPLKRKAASYTSGIRRNIRPHKR